MVGRLEGSCCGTEGLYPSKGYTSPDKRRVLDGMVAFRWRQ